MSKEFPIISKLGGRSAVKSALESRGMPISYRGLSHWACRGRIAGQYVPIIMEIAETEGVEYRSSDFVSIDQGSGSNLHEAA